MTNDKIQFVNTYAAPIKSLWDLWITKEGFESWFGPVGFRTEVYSIDFVIGGKLSWAMIAESPEIKAFMEQSGQALKTDHIFVFTQINYPHSFTYKANIDFLEDVPPYENEVSVSFVETTSGTQMTILIDPLHDQIWTERAKLGWQSQLTKINGIFR